MSMMNCLAAIQAVLDKASGRMENLMVIRVAPDSEPALSSRRLTLPLSEDAQLAFALGCAQAGMRVVLDLTAARDAVNRLGKALEALPRAARAPLVIRARARRCPPLPGVHVIAPANARECAGAMRYALQYDGICLIAESPLVAYEACEVPDEPNELFPGAPEDTEPAEEAAQTVIGLPAEEAAPEAPAEGAALEAPAEEPAPAEEASMEESLPAPKGGAMAFRCRAYDPAELLRTASLLNVAPRELAALCCTRAGESAEVVLETDSAPGETAFIPPEKADACLWVGCDRVALCWNSRAMSARAARALLAETAARLELPARLILERKG